MKIQIASDLHLEARQDHLPALATSTATGATTF